MTKPANCKPSCEQIIDILPGPFMIIDRDYRIVSTNEAYRKHYDVRSEDVVGRHCYEVSHRSRVPCSQNGEHCPLEDCFRSGEVAHVVHVHYDKHGAEEQVQLQAVPILDANGRVLYIGEYVQPPRAAAEEHALLVGRSRLLLRMISLLQRVAPTQTTVLLLGESGVGKERVAQYLHHYSNRSGHPFVVVDCSTLGENLIESELFGYERGAFTGAARLKRGLFEAARGGTLFIDEIGELPLQLQSKLLRVLETGAIRRLGGTDYVPVDVRIIAATHRDLPSMVEAGQFRHDLYYRLSAFPIEVPTLRERKDDIPALAEYFLSHLPDGERQIPLSPSVTEKLLDYEYPGNVRELGNIIERAAILAGDGVIEPEHIRLKETPRRAAEGRSQDDKSLSNAGQAPHRRHRHSDEDVLRVLRQCDGHRLAAAQRLGMSERTLYRRLRRMRD